MRIFKTRAFSRLPVANELSDANLISAVAEMNEGLWDANLGGQVYKKRVALTGRGKSGGARTLVAFINQKRCFFIYGFAKNQRSNVTIKETLALKCLARELLGYDEKQLSDALRQGALIEMGLQGNDQIHS